MRACICNLFASAMIVGCSPTPADLGTDAQGVAELRVDAGPLLAASVTRVSIDAAGQTQDLALDPSTGTFDGTLFLPAGMQSLVAHAFSGDALVGQSQPTPVQVTPQAVTRIMLRILDLTGNPPQVFGPIIDSLSFPTTASASTPVSFAVSAIAPHGDPVSYAWSADCMDSTFTAPSAATTGWSKATQGTCAITVTVTSSGVSVTQMFGILVFPSGSNTGAVDVDATFITAPAILLSLGVPGCGVQLGGNGSCPDPIASPTASFYEAAVFGWGGSTPGTLDVSDSCGGKFGESSRNDSEIFGFWLPPTAASVCFVTLQAVNGDGLASTVTAAVVVHPGTAPTVQPPQASANLDNGCSFGPPDSPSDCGAFPAATERTMFGSVAWNDGHPGSVTVRDDCVGPVPEPSNASFFSTSWLTSSNPGDTCTVTLRAVDLEGVATEIAARYHVVAAPPGG